MLEDHITARSITVVDAAGRPRIMMNGGEGDGFATLTVISTTGERLDISAQPHGTIALSLGDTALLHRIVMTTRGFDLRARDGGAFAVTIGDFFDEGVDRVIVYRNGEVVWSMPVPDAAKP
jgi:hypothetical protein